MDANNKMETNVAFGAFGKLDEVEEKTTEKAVENMAGMAKTAPMFSNETSAFAEGLPEWDILPPQVMVRRR